MDDQVYHERREIIGTLTLDSTYYHYSVVTDVVPYSFGKPLPFVQFPNGRITCRPALWASAVATCSFWNVSTGPPSVLYYLPDDIVLDFYTDFAIYSDPDEEEYRFGRYITDLGLWAVEKSK